MYIMLLERVFHAPRKDVWCIHGARYERAPNFSSPAKTNRRKICIVKINTFVMALMFILRELKNIPSGE